MRDYRCLLLYLVGMLLTVSLAAPHDAPIAVVCLAEGEVMRQAPAAARGRSLVLLDLIMSSEVVITGAESRLIIAYLDGRRFELAAETIAVIEPDEPKAETGRVIPLEPISVVPDLSPIASTERVGRDTATSRIGTDTEWQLEPRTGGAVLADSASVRFAPVPGARSYRVAIEGRKERIFEVTTSRTDVAVPPGTLEPGVDYVAWVSTWTDGGYPQRASTVFLTLAEGVAERRNRLAATALASRDPELVVLLAAYDRGLGLYREACNELEVVAELGGGKDGVAEVFERLTCLEAPESGQ